MSDNKTSNRKTISLNCYSLCLYFILLPFDFINIAGLGSILRIVAIIPIFLSLYSLLFSVRIRFDSIHAYLVLLSFIASISVLYSVNHNYSISAVKTLWLNVLLIIFVTAFHFYDSREISALIKSLIIGSWISVILVLLFGTSEYGRVTILMGEAHQDQNYLCGFMMFAFVYHLTNYFKSTSVKHLLSSFLIILAVILTGSRGALLSFILIIVIGYIINGKQNGVSVKTLVSTTVLILSFALVIIFVVIPRLDTMLYMRYTIEYLIEKGTTGRTDIWNYLLNKYFESSIFRQAFGYGYGTTVLVNSMGGVMDGKVAHNLYIDNLLSIGAFGFFSTIALHVSCVKTSLKNSLFYTLLMIGFITMCLSMSLTSYKPLWSTIIMLIITNQHKQAEAVHNVK